MANAITKIRTNYVEITDIKRFNEIIARCCSENKISVITHTENDKIKYGFLCDGDIDGIPLPNDECVENDCEDCEKYNCIACEQYKNFMCDPDCSFDMFIDELQKVIAPGDAMIITIIGYENLRYLQGQTIVITSEHCESKSIDDVSMELARKLLNDPNWETQNYY